MKTVFCQPTTWKSPQYSSTHSSSLRLRLLERKPPRYENSYYGPLNGLLSFTLGSKFVVKPQAVLRPNIPKESSTHLPAGVQRQPGTSRVSTRIAAFGPGTPATPTGHSPQSSVDSIGGSVLSRKEGGAEIDLRFPDLMTVLPTADGKSDVIQNVMEVKLNDYNFEKYKKQLFEYMDIIDGKLKSRNFTAFLVAGPITYWWRLGGDDPDSGSCETGSEEMIRLIIYSTLPV
ncbi:hypothetical protein BD410DRAFT_803004 [Rickenella mellea]|uniref:Uncharacterized protein n=1 Tax=Rickenella mellea TaxID=50990 RepID=A0A4Y7Q6J7_9AGAM|nr:hypothetical protein BD410DRAFT_803004 [Rickenella mellea]